MAHKQTNKRKQAHEVRLYNLHFGCTLTFNITLSGITPAGAEIVAKHMMKDIEATAHLQQSWKFRTPKFNKFVSACRMGQDAWKTFNQINN